MVITDELLREHHVLVARDNAFQRRARLHQALWREQQGFPIGQHRGRPLGSRLAMPFAEESLCNYLTENIRRLVRAEVKRPEKLYRAPRIYEDLLSSQPLCFNLFGELQHDLELATRVVAILLGHEVRLTGIEFEHSPGRGDPRFTGDRSAFDVYVDYEADGDQGFLGIEVKYVEDLDVGEAALRSRYDEIADAMRIFKAESRERLRVRPLEQFWREHLLACSMLLDEASRFDTGKFVVLYPSGNQIVAAAVREYVSCLTDSTTFTAWTLERFLDALDEAGASGWAKDVRERYVPADGC